jgi:hypothetical protein
MFKIGSCKLSITMTQGITLMRSWCLRGGAVEEPGLGLRELGYIPVLLPS